MGVIGNVKVTSVFKTLDDANFARLCAATARQIDESPDTMRSGVLYEVFGAGDMNAKRRKAMGEILAGRKEKLARITAGYVLVTSSPIVRGLLTAVFWFAPPGYDSHVAATVAEAFLWLRPRTPGGVDVPATLAAYEELIRA